MNLLNEGIKITLVSPAAADGSTDPVLTNVDMAGYDGVLFLCTVGTITGSGTVTMAIGQAATDTTVDALSGASVVATASTESDKIIAVDIFRPLDRYVGGTVTRAVANAILGGVIAIQYKAANRPVTQSGLADTLVALVSPAES